MANFKLHLYLRTYLEDLHYYGFFTHTHTHTHTRTRTHTHTHTHRRAKMPFGVADRSLVQRIKHIDDDENKTHFVVYKQYVGEHPNAPDVGDTVR